MMRQFVLSLLFVLVLAGGIGLLQVKARVEHRAQTVAQLTDRIARDREAIRVLKAERAYLASPARIAPAAHAALGLAPLEPDRVLASFAAIPFRLDPDAPVDEGEPQEPPRPRPADPGVVVIVASNDPADDHRLLLELAELRR